MKFLTSYIDYIKDNPNKLWFKSKWYGWGWTPVTWQGWLATALYVAVLVVSSNILVQTFSKDDFNAPFMVIAVLSTLVFLYVAYKKGEKPHWSWGRPKAK